MPSLNKTEQILKQKIETNLTGNEAGKLFEKFQQKFVSRLLLLRQMMLTFLMLLFKPELWLSWEPGRRENNFVFRH